MADWHNIGGRLVPSCLVFRVNKNFFFKMSSATIFKFYGEISTLFALKRNIFNFFLIFYFMLYISEPPAVHSVRKFVNISLGSHLELECIGMGKPRPLITWYHNGRFLKHSAGGKANLYYTAQNS